MHLFSKILESSIKELKNNSRKDDFETAVERSGGARGGSHDLWLPAHDDCSEIMASEIENVTATTSGRDFATASGRAHGIGTT